MPFVVNMEQTKQDLVILAQAAFGHLGATIYELGLMSTARCAMMNHAQSTQGLSDMSM